jgi:Kef-type K+ transport system membrane component KefB
MEYLTDMIILLSATVIAAPLFQSLGLRAIPGFLVAGVVLIENPIHFVSPSIDFLLSILQILDPLIFN